MMMSSGPIHSLTHSRIHASTQSVLSDQWMWPRNPSWSQGNGWAADDRRANKDEAREDCRMCGELPNQLYRFA